MRWTPLYESESQRSIERPPPHPGWASGIGDPSGPCLPKMNSGHSTSYADLALINFLPIPQLHFCSP